MEGRYRDRRVCLQHEGNSLVEQFSVGVTKFMLKNKRNFVVSPYGVGGGVDIVEAESTVWGEDFPFHGIACKNRD
jgi:hypothetical protein